jgi:hypothetical protein
VTVGTTFSSGGFRFYDANHTVSYNYVQNIIGGHFQGPLQLDAGEVEGTSTNLDAHWRIVNALVERNVIIQCPEGIRIGDNFALAPTGCTIRDNVVAQTVTGTAVTQVLAPVNSTLTNNTYSSTPAGAGLTLDSATIWRKSGYGPRLTYLQAADVGILGDAADADGTGALISGAPAAQTITPVGIGTRQAIGFPIILGADTAPPPGSVPTLLGSSNTYLGAATLGYTIPGSQPPPSPSGSQTVAGAGNIASRETLGVPLLTIADGPLTVAGIGITSGETFGRPNVSVNPAPLPAPGGVLVPALFAVAQDGTTLTPLPNWSKITISPVRNSPGSVSIEYPADAPGFDTLNDAVSAYPLKIMEFRLWLGGNATGALGGWLVQKSGDDLTPGSMWTFTGFFHEWLLAKALVAPQPKTTANDSGELKFAAATAGLIFATLMDQAQSRGALPLVTRDFTSATDSNGRPWVNSISSLNLSPGTTTVQQVADKLVELGMVEYELTSARVWRAYNPGTRGTDRTVGGTPLTFAQASNVSQHSMRESALAAGTAVLAVGSEGFYEWAESATAKAQLGWRAEVGVSAGQISSDAGVLAAAITELEIAENGTSEVTGAIETIPGSPLPLIDYRVGDWAYIVVGGERQRLRIAQIGLTFQPGRPPAGTVTFNDLIADTLTTLTRRFNAITTGDAVVGTSIASPGGQGDDFNPPAAPIGVVISSTIAYRVPAEDTVLALVSVGWAAVTNNAYPNNDTAGKAQAADYIASRMRSGETLAADWTWNQQPLVVQLYANQLQAEWKAAGSTPTAVTWLAAYSAAHLGGGTITDDIDHYVVQYSYIGGTVVGSFQPTPDWVAPRDPNDPSGTGVDFSWHEPEESPTNGLAITFGDVTADRAIGVRVAAVDRSGNHGPWSAVVGVVTAADDTPPPTPSKPITKAWFRTMDITWDGFGSSGEDMRAAAPDLNGIEVHVDTGIDFIPDRPIGADGKVDLSLSGTFKSMLFAAGTWNVTDLTIGVTYFARFVAVDNAGNASPPSATSDGVLPQQLVNIDIGPNAIAREQIIDGEIVNGKIANLAVNDANIAAVNVGKLTAGTMTATVVLGGRFITPSSNNNHIEIDSAGIRLYQGNSVVGRWQVFDASMMVTGQFNTAITGSRIVMNPGGANPDTIRFYPTFSDVYSSIDSVSYGNGLIAGIRIVGSANTTSGHRGMLVIRDQYSSIVNALPDLSDWGSEMYVEEHFTRNRSAAVDLVIDERLTAVGGPPRVAMIYYDVSGSPINATGLYYKKTDFNGGEPQFYANGQDCALVFAPDGLKIRNNPNGDWRDIWYATAHVMSGRDTKRDISDFDGDSVATLRSINAKRFRRKTDPNDAPERIGFIAEDMPRPIRTTSISPATDPDNPPLVAEAIDYSAVTTVLWAATQQIEERVTALEARAHGPNTPSGP